MRVLHKKHFLVVMLLLLSVLADAQVMVLKPTIKEKQLVGTCIFNPNRNEYAIYPQNESGYGVYRQVFNFDAQSIFYLTEELDTFYVLTYSSIDSNINSFDGKNEFEIIAGKNDFISFDSIGEPRQKQILYALTDSMLMLQNHYLANYDFRGNRFPDSTEYLPYINDMFYYRHVYKKVESYMQAHSIQDYAFFEKTLRINLMGGYYYNGDSGEGYYTFAYLLATKPKWLVAIFKKSKDIKLKKAIIERINNYSQWSYGLGFWYYVFVEVHPDLLKSGEGPYSQTFKKEVLTKYKKWMIQIDKDWDMSRFL